MSTAVDTTQSQPSHLPGELGVWIFILGDMTIFALFFATFVFYRSEQVDIFRQSQTLLNQNLGALNTLLLLASSWLVVTAVNAARRGLSRTAGTFLSLAWLCGLGFGVVKFFEYGEKLNAGITLTTNDFFMYYYVFTGIHFFHLLLGMGVLAYLVSVTRRGRLGDKELMLLEGGASFWHMVDLLWIVLFPLLYLVQ